MALIAYNTTGAPTENGVYACRVPHKHIPELCADEFFMWYDGRWKYCGSDQKYRGEVLGWIGPLQRRFG